MIRSPHYPASHGQRTTAFAESLDFYRSLVGLTAPSLSAEIEPTVEGVDLTPLFVGAAPSGSSGPAVAAVPNNVSFSQMARCPCGKAYPCTQPGIESACNSVPRNVTPFMGYSIRVENYRYNAWIAFDGLSNRGKWAEAERSGGGTEWQELYDHHGDDGTNWADGYENENIADAQPS